MDEKRSVIRIAATNVAFKETGDDPTLAAKPAAKPKIKMPDPNKKRSGSPPVSNENWPRSRGKKTKQSADDRAKFTMIQGDLLATQNQLLKALTR